jgi:hypothetical protein
MEGGGVGRSALLAREGRADGLGWEFLVIDVGLDRAQMAIKCDAGKGGKVGTMLFDDHEQIWSFVWLRS